MVGAAREPRAARRGASIRLMPRAIDVEKTVLAPAGTLGLGAKARGIGNATAGRGASCAGRQRARAGRKRR
jgi:hypothetical protein